MANLKDVFTIDTLMIILTVLGFIGTFYGIIQNNKSKKELKKYDYLFNVAGQNMDLEDKSKTINDYQNQIIDMQKEIEVRIPSEAKRIALNEMLYNEINELSSSYSKVKMIQNELNKIGQNTDQNNDLINNVINTIEPSYSQNRSNNLFNMIFYSVSLLSSVLSFILPGDIYRFISIIIVIFQFVFVTKMVGNYIKNNYSKNELYSYLNKAFLSISVLLLMISLFTLLFAIIEFIKFPIQEEKSLEIFSLITYVIHLFFDLFYFIKNKNSKKKFIFIVIANLFILIGIGLLCFSYYDIISIIGLFLIIISSMIELITSLTILLNGKKNRKKLRKSYIINKKK